MLKIGRVVSKDMEKQAVRQKSLTQVLSFQCPHLKILLTDRTNLNHDITMQNHRNCSVTLISFNAKLLYF